MALRSNIHIAVWNGLIAFFASIFCLVQSSVLFKTLFYLYIRSVWFDHVEGFSRSPINVMHVNPYVWGNFLIGHLSTICIIFSFSLLYLFSLIFKLSLIPFGISCSKKCNLLLFTTFFINLKCNINLMILKKNRRNSSDNLMTL